MSPEQAATGLAAIVGSGGISGIMIAVMSFLTEARKGRKPSEGPAPVVAIGDAFARSKWDEEAVGHLSAIATVLIRLVAVKEIEAEEAYADKDFADRLESKEARILREIGRQGTASVTTTPLSPEERAKRQFRV